MHYKCNKCEYEFDVFVKTHPHPINSFISFGAYGCPICNQALVKSKVCPKCGSLDLKESVKKEEISDGK